MIRLRLFTPLFVLNAFGNFISVFAGGIIVDKYFFLTSVI